MKVLLLLLLLLMMMMMMAKFSQVGDVLADNVIHSALVITAAPSLVVHNASLQLSLGT